MKNKILGDKRKSSFDDNLANVVNEIFDNQPEVVVPKPEVIDSSNKLLSDDEIFVIDETVLLNAHTRSQYVWLNNWPANGSVMISMSNVYDLAKRFRKNDFIMVCEYDDKNLISSTPLLPVERFKENFINDLRSPYSLITSTRLKSFKDSSQNREFKLIQHCNKELKFIVEEDIHVPRYTRTPLEVVLRTNDGVDFLRALFKTQDSADEIEKNINYLFNKKGVFVFTPQNDSILFNSDHVCSIYESSSFDGFIISTGENLVFAGRTRGVRYV